MFKKITDKENNELYKKAKKLYIKGTRFESLFDTLKDSKDIFTIKGENIGYWANTAYKEGEALCEENSPGLIYVKGKWAKILKERTINEKNV